MNEEERRRFAAYLGRQPKRKIERTCDVCGEKFMGTRRAKYCSRRCESIAYRLRKKAPDAPTGEAL